MDRRPDLVPQPFFVDMPAHMAQLADLVRDLARGEDALLLIGNQGLLPCCTVVQRYKLLHIPQVHANACCWSGTAGTKAQCILLCWAATMLRRNTCLYVVFS